MRLPAAILPALLGLSLGAAARAQELPVDWLKFNVSAGYDGYALPVANSALGRGWTAERGTDAGLAWQIGRNMSVVPVRLNIEHRLATAFKGRVEIVSAHGYAREEDPLGHLTYVSQELLVPPSVPVTLFLAPRVCPPSAPGMPVWLTLRLYQGDNRQPRQEMKLSVTQLEPYYLYSLYLDGPPQHVYQDKVNPGNGAMLHLPGQQSTDPAAYETANFTLTVAHDWLTGLPLAARDFAFVFANYAQVMHWTEAEQDALQQFCIGGGHLCLFDAPGGVWRGIPLGQGAQEVGRGRLLPVAGGFANARAAVVGWLTGELEEFVLWSGGSARGERFTDATGQAALALRLGLRYPFLLQDPQQPFISHRRGYMNPVWIYREACLSGSIEPWDYPEFNTQAHEVLSSGEYASVFGPQDRPPPLTPLGDFTEPRRGIPGRLAALLLLLPLGACLPAASRRFRGPAVLLAAAVLGSALALWWLAQPRPHLPCCLSLTDADLRCQPQARRALIASQAGRDGKLGFAVPQGAIVRRVAWASPGAWEVTQERNEARWRGWDGQAHAAVALDIAAGGTAPAWPVKVRATRLDARRVSILLDTRGLPVGERCLLLSRAGWVVVPGGQTRVAVELELREVPVQPGLQRLKALAEAAGGPVQFMVQARVGQVESDRLLRDLLLEGWPAVRAGPLERLAWAGLVQQPQRNRGMLGNQALLFVPLGRTADAAGQEEALQFLRLAIPLGGPGQ